MGIYMVTHKMVLLAQETRNIFYYDTQVGEPSDAEWQDVADEIRAEFLANLASEMTTQLSLYGIDHRRVDIAGLLSFSKSFTGGTISGSNVGDPVATQIACLVSNKGVTTKPNRARSYIGGGVEGNLNLSLWTGTMRGACEAWIDFQSAVNGGGTNPLTRVSAQWNSSHTAVIVTNDISGAASVASIVPATQRRRRIGVGI